MILELLAREEADFDLDLPGKPAKPLEADAARRYLENPAVLHWVAVEDDAVIGTLQCILLPLRAGEGQELLLYEIGVRSGWRRRGIGSALLGQVEAWMRANDVSDIWVLADNPGAVEFYRAGGFPIEEPQPTYMLRRVSAR